MPALRAPSPARPVCNRYLRRQSASATTAPIRVREQDKNWRLASPNFGFYYLLCELLGATDDESDYVYLSDGGHFDLAQALRFGIAG